MLQTSILISVTLCSCSVSSEPIFKYNKQVSENTTLLIPHWSCLWAARKDTRGGEVSPLSYSTQKSF